MYEKNQHFEEKERRRVWKKASKRTFFIFIESAIFVCTEQKRYKTLYA